MSLPEKVITPAVVSSGQASYKLTVRSAAAALLDADFKDARAAKRHAPAQRPCGLPAM